MEILNTLLSQNADYLTALRFAQQLPVVLPTAETTVNPPPITNNKKVSKKLLWGLGIVASIVVIYLIANKIKKRNQEKNSSSL